MIHIPAPILVTVEEHGEGDPDQQRGELGLVIHQQLESNPQDAAVFHGAPPFHQPAQQLHVAMIAPRLAPCRAGDRK
jgi:hypothetical protein